MDRPRSILGQYLCSLHGAPVNTSVEPPLPPWSLCGQFPWSLHEGHMEAPGRVHGASIASISSLDSPCILHGSFIAPVERNLHGGIIEELHNNVYPRAGLVGGLFVLLTFLLFVPAGRGGGFISFHFFVLFRLLPRASATPIARRNAPCVPTPSPRVRTVWLETRRSPSVTTRLREFFTTASTSRRTFTWFWAKPSGSALRTAPTSTGRSSVFFALLSERTFF